MKYTLHLDNDGVLKCPIQANFEQVMHVQSWRTPSFGYEKVCLGSKSYFLEWGK